MPSARLVTIWAEAGCFDEREPMMLYLDRRGQAPLLAAHVTDFRGVRSSVMWRRAARQQLTSLQGLLFWRSW